ncbi:MAG: hypothetical protein LBU06_05750 [Desulfovibrio sp.]|jgi:hypothetical protein|nr:hypothetical protein [Desulfovibrio sp.]
MQSTVQLFNTALARLGGEIFVPLASPAEDGELGRLCANLFPHVLCLTLEAFGWSFAVKRALLAEPVFAGPAHPDYPVRCALPADCLRPLELDGETGISPCFILEGGHLLCDARPAVLTYVARVDDPRLWPSWFADILAWGLAAELATARINDPRRQQFYAQQYRFALSEGIAGDKNRQKRRKPVSPWQTARFGGAACPR